MRRDLVWSLVLFVLASAALLFILWGMQSYFLTQKSVKDYIPSPLMRNLDFRAQNEKASQIIGSISWVGLMVYLSEQIIALVWLCIAGTRRVYKPGMARTYLKGWWGMLAIAFIVSGAVALDGFWTCYLQTSLQFQIIDDIRRNLMGVMILYSIISFWFTTAIGIPLVMRPATPGSATVGRAIPAWGG
jgi:hypothetical protein